VAAADEVERGRLGQALLTSPAKHATLSSPGALRAVAGIGLFLCVTGLLALGIAVVVRHTAGAISVYVFVLLVLQSLSRGSRICFSARSSACSPCRSVRR
jgi:hypothetical protein